MRRGFTLFEALVVLGIVATLVAWAVWPAVMVRTGHADRHPPQSWSLLTVQHDGHWWVKSTQHFVHHPDCPCHTKRAEADSE